MKAEGNITSMGNSIKRLYADTASPPSAKRPKTTNACHDKPHDDASGDESADSADSSALLQVTRAVQEPAAPKELSDVRDPSTSFLGNKNASLPNMATGSSRRNLTYMAARETATRSLYQK